MAKIGKVIDIPWVSDFVWRIENFSTLSTEEDKCYESPFFYFANASWCLMIYPNGEKEDESIGYIGVYLCRKSPGPPITLNYSLILKTMNEKTDREMHTSDVFEKTDVDFGWSNFLKRSEYLESRSELGLPDVFTVICTIKYLDRTGVASDKVTTHCSYCKKTSEAETISFHEGKCLDKPIKCPDCFDVIYLRDWYDHQCQKSGSEVSEKMSGDFKELLLNGDNRDTIIKVRGEEIPVHRDILVARNTYFSSIFKNDMKEKNTGVGVVSIDDCEPDIFRTFVHFIYTGKVDKLSPENVCNLYEIADKYKEDQMKKECLHFMMKSLSEDTFCDYIVLALKYDEKKLFENSVELFTSKPKEIICSMKWQIFTEEYTTQANELFIKILDKYIM